MSPTCSHSCTSAWRAMIWRTVSNSPWMSPNAPMSMGRMGGRGGTGGRGSPDHPASPASPAFPALSSGRRRRHEKISLVPDEVVLAVDRELVILAHEDRADRARLFA